MIWGDKVTQSFAIPSHWLARHVCVYMFFNHVKCASLSSLDFHCVYSLWRITFDVIDFNADLGSTQFIRTISFNWSDKWHLAIIWQASGINLFIELLWSYVHQSMWLRERSSCYGYQRANKTGLFCFVIRFYPILESTKHFSEKVIPVSIH